MNGDDAPDRTVTLNYYANGRIESLQANERSVTYTYTDGNLTHVDLADGSFFDYVYNDPNELSPKHNLTTVLDSATPTPHVVETHSYNESDRVEHTESEGGMEAFAFDYDTPGQTTVTNALDVPTVYHVDSFSGVVNRTDTCPTCAGGVK